MVLKWFGRSSADAFDSTRLDLNSDTNKFRAVESCNNNKGFVDLMDQIAAYFPFFRRLEIECGKSAFPKIGYCSRTRPLQKFTSKSSVISAAA
ncbi:hypothetical protein KIN20_023933 [Parelaphostrongylus tenuis]|uniref:Uncharacterized protein n=1 Tax=Parelaphostrongylus tenuis TaxID=148309 RepID=A0AAD5MXM1_PARTN|nr:hypothetical protein KIN20_023933 [Parelaphostrongylus tenuis]